MALPPISRLLGQPLTYKTEALLLATPLPAGRLCFALQEETYWVSITGGYLPVGGAGGGGGGDVTASPSPLEAGRIMIGGGGTNAATSTDPDLTEANLSALLDSHLGQTYGDVTASPSPLEAGRMMVGGGGTNTATSTDPDLTEANLSQLLDDFLGQTPGTGDVIASPAPLELDRVMLGGGSTNTATSTDPDLTGANLSALLDSHLGQTYGDVTASPSPLEAGRMMVGGGGTNAATSTDVDLTEANLSALLDSHLGQTYGDVTASPSPLVLDRVMLGGGTVNTSTSTDIDLTGTNLSQLIDEHLGQTYVIAQSAGVEDRIVRWRLDGTPGQYLISSALTSRDNGDLHHHTQGGFRVSGTLADSSDDLEFLYLHGHAVGTHGTVALGFPATNAVPGSSTNAAYFKVGHSVQLWRWNAGSRTDVNSYGAFTIAHDEGEVAIGKLTVDPTGGATAGVEDAFTMTIPNEPPSVTTSIDGPWTAFPLEHVLGISVNGVPQEYAFPYSPSGIVYTPQQLADEINANFTGVQASVVAGDPNKVVIRGIAGGSTEEIGIIAGTTWDWSSALGLAGGTYTGTDFTVKRPGQAGADLEADIFLQGTTAINGVLDPTGVSLIMQATAPIAAPAAGTRVLWAAPDGSLRVSSNVDDATLLTNVEGAAPVQGDYIPVYADNTGSGLKDNLYWSIDSAAPYALEYRTDQSVVTTGGIFNIMVGSSTQPTVPAGCHATIISNENPTDDALMMLVGGQDAGFLFGGGDASLKYNDVGSLWTLYSNASPRLRIGDGAWVGTTPMGDPGAGNFAARWVLGSDGGGAPAQGGANLTAHRTDSSVSQAVIDLVCGDQGSSKIRFRNATSTTNGLASIEMFHGFSNVNELRFYNDSTHRWTIHEDGGFSCEGLPSRGVNTINANESHVISAGSTFPTLPTGCSASFVNNAAGTDDSLVMIRGARESGLLLGANASLKWSESTAGLAFNSYSEDRLQINQGVWVGAFPNGDPGPESFGAKSIQAVNNGSPNPGLGQLLVQNDGVPTDRCAIDMVAGDSGRCSVFFRSSSSPGAGNGSIQYEHAAAEMRFYNSQLRWVIHADGGLTAQNAGLLPSFGVGTINASGLYDDGVLLTDYVFEAFYEGKPRDEKHADYQMKTLEEELQHTKDHLHLSTMPSRAEWEESGKKSMGELTTRLWETVETQMLYIKTLLDRITVLEEKINS